MKRDTKNSSACTDMANNSWTMSTDRTIECLKDATDVYTCYHLRCTDMMMNSHIARFQVL